MSNIFEQLLSSGSNNSPSAELLESLGKQAARRYLENGEPLNQAIIDLTSQHSNLENEHVKRIAEFANNSVFQDLHSKEMDKNVHFDVADPGVIIRDLKDGGSPAHDGKTLNQATTQKKSFVPSAGSEDYRRPPGSDSAPDHGSGGMGVDSALNTLFQMDEHSGTAGHGEQISKTASLNIDHSGHANPIEDVYDEHVRLQVVREKVAGAHETFDLLVKQAREEFYQEVKRTVLDPDGPGLAGVTHAVKLASPSDSIAFSALKPVAERLVAEGAIRSDGVQKLAYAGKILNPEHPVIKTFSGFVRAAQEKANAREGLSQVDKALSKTASFLKAHVQ
jgi:hypothetical protein